MCARVCQRSHFSRHTPRKPIADKSCEVQFLIAGRQAPCFGFLRTKLITTQIPIYGYQLCGCVCVCVCEPARCSDIVPTHCTLDPASHQQHHPSTHLTRGSHFTPRARMPSIVPVYLCRCRCVRESMLLLHVLYEKPPV